MTSTLVAIPETPQELEELLQDPKKLTDIFKNNQMGDLIRSYAKNVHQKDQTIATQVREETQRVLNQMARDGELEGDVKRLNLRVQDVPAPENQRHGFYNPRAMGAAIDQEFGSLSEYFSAIWHHAPKDATAQARIQRVRNAFSSTVPSEGGFLIPETLRSEMLKNSLETAIVRSRARVIPMETLRVPFPCIDSTSNVSSVYGGLVGYWTEEGGTLVQSQARFGRLTLDAKKLTIYSEIPSELFADSQATFQAFLTEAFPEALAYYEDYAFFLGTGVGEPLGFLNGDCAVEVTPEVGQPADTIVWENLIKAFSRMLPGAQGRAVWVAAIDTFPELATMSLSVGTGGSAIWLNNGVTGPPMTILGRPVLFTEKAPKLGDAGDITFVDFGNYLIGDRQVMAAASSDHYKFQNDVTALRVIERVDGRPWMNSAITPKNGSANTLSPIVKVGAR